MVLIRWGEWLPLPASQCAIVQVSETAIETSQPTQVTTVGLDLAKNIFHIHGVTETGELAFNRPLRRAQVLAFFARLSPCLIGIEACASSHHWGRERTKHGHTARLMPPMYVKPYVKRGKSDAVDTDAICEAVTRPTMRFVEIKSEDQQALLSLHRARDFVVRQRTQLINMLRSLAAESGIVIARGVARAIDFAKGIIEGKQSGFPELAQDVLRVLSRQLVALHNRLRWYEITMRIQARLSRQAQLLQTIPGVGPATASAVAATIGSGHQFKSGREFAAWLGLTPRNHSSGGKERLGKITIPLGTLRAAIPCRAMDGRSVSAPAYRCRHDIACVAGHQSSRACRSLANEAAATEAGPARDRRHGEQDGADHVGGSDQE